MNDRPVDIDEQCSVGKGKTVAGRDDVFVDGKPQGPIDQRIYPGHPSHGCSISAGGWTMGAIAPTPGAAKNTGGAAFPRPFSKNGEFSDSQKNQSQEGMTLRDYFAAKAMTMCAPLDASYAVCEYDTQVMTRCAEHAYAMADAMIKARSN